MNPDVASAFLATFHGFQNWKGSSRKTCEAVWSQARFQGLRRHIERYRNSPVMHEDVCHNYNSGIR